MKISFIPDHLDILERLMRRRKLPGTCYRKNIAQKGSPDAVPEVLYLTLENYKQMFYIVLPSR
jgi:hypothetical protein